MILEAQEEEDYHLLKRPLAAPVLAVILFLIFFRWNFSFYRLSQMDKIIIGAIAA